jgi:hypothetical protein
VWCQGTGRRNLPDREQVLAIHFRPFGLEGRHGDKQFGLGSWVGAGEVIGQLFQDRRLAAGPESLREEGLSWAEQDIRTLGLHDMDNGQGQGVLVVSGTGDLS